MLAGGQSLIPMMKLRFAFPEMLVDVNRVPGLDYIDDSDGHLRVGALVRHNDVVASDVVGARQPHDGGGGAVDLRPARPEPRDGLRIGRARRPARRLGAR